MNTRLKNLKSHNNRPPARGTLLSAVLVACAVLVGCNDSKPTLETEYGRCSTKASTMSINGMRGLLNLFEQGGFRPLVTNRISPQINRFDTIVWVHHNNTPPSREQIANMEEWLSDEGKTLVFIGANYTAESEYWESILDQVPEDQYKRFEQELASSKSRAVLKSQSVPEDEYIGWYTQRRGKGPRKITGLTGDWSKDVDAKKADMNVWSYLDIPRKEDQTEIEIESYESESYSYGDDDFYYDEDWEVDYLYDDGMFNDVQLDERTPIDSTVLLGAVTGDEQADPVPMVFMLHFDGSFEGEAIIINNPSFLSNFGLVNPERRQIADRLVRVCHARSENHKVLFIDGYRGAPVRDYETFEGSQGFEALMVWPINWILLHLMILGILYCFARYPIFGRPRGLPSRATTDFGQHIEALGKQLRAVGDEAYARDLILHYHKLHEDRDET